MPPASRARFEPDYSLVPAGEYQTTFTTETLASTLEAALSEDGAREERLAYSKLLFETDPLTASDDLLQLIDSLVERSQERHVEVWRPGAPLGGRAW
jgi:hypothetical protein